MNKKSVLWFFGFVVFYIIAMGIINQNIMFGSAVLVLSIIFLIKAADKEHIYIHHNIIKLEEK